MSGRGFAPKAASSRRGGHAPQRGDWQASPGIGWQHGPIPAPPSKPALVKATAETWQTWFRAWFAAHWGPEDLPMLRSVIRLYDKVERGSATAAERTELRQLSDSYGITPKGQQDRRWTPPKAEAPAATPTGSGPDASPGGAEPETPGGRLYSHLRDVSKSA